MQDDIAKIYAQLNDLQVKVDSFNSSNDIDRQTQTSLSERLQSDPSFLSNFMIWGKVNTVSGTVKVYDSRISQTSTVLFGQDTSGTSDLVYATRTNGSVTFGSTGSNVFGIYYLIIFNACPGRPIVS